MKWWLLLEPAGWAKCIALNHPNIVSMFDIGEENGMVFFVSELVDGELLRARIERGPMAIRDLLDIAIQLADGCPPHTQSASAIAISNPRM
jgi:serine/threonine protein kinase